MIKIGAIFYSYTLIMAADCDTVNIGMIRLNV